MKETNALRRNAFVYKHVSVTAFSVTRGSVCVRKTPEKYAILQKRQKTLENNE